MSDSTLPGEPIDRLDRLVDAAAAVLIGVFTFSLPLPEQGLSIRSLVFPLIGWLLFVSMVALAWSLHREVARARGRAAGPDEQLLHLPFLAAMLLFSVPARRMGAVLLYDAGPERRSEFIGSLRWYSILLVVVLVALAGMIAAAGPAAGDGRQESLRRSSRIRLHLGAGVIAAATSLALPRFGGAALLLWIVFPVWYAIEKRHHDSPAGEAPRLP